MMRLTAIFLHFQPLFLPAPLTDAAGRELATVTALGSFLAASVFAEEDPQVAEKHFSGKQNSAAGNSNVEWFGLFSPKIKVVLRKELLIVHPTILTIPSFAVRAAAKQLQTDLEFYRNTLHKLFHGLLVNASSRDSTLRYLAEVRNFVYSLCKQRNF